MQGKPWTGQQSNSGHNQTPILGNYYITEKCKKKKKKNNEQQTNLNSGRLSKPLLVQFPSRMLMQGSNAICSHITHCLILLNSGVYTAYMMLLTISPGCGYTEPVLFCKASIPRLRGSAYSASVSIYPQNVAQSMQVMGKGPSFSELFRNEKINSSYD